MRRLAPLVLMFAMLVLAACVERKEHLAISPDGSVLWQVRMASDSMDDLLKGDAVPTPGGLWIVHQEEQRDDEGTVTHILNAETAFAARRKLPDGFGTALEIEQGLCLAFPTSITFEKRKDGTYCHFARRYSPRAWQEIDALRLQHIEPIAGSLDTDIAAWTPEQRLGVTQAFARFEVEKEIVFARAAWLETLPREPQDHYLAIVDDLRGLLLTLDYARLSNLLAPAANEMEQEALDQAIKLEGEQLHQSIIARLGEAAQKAGALEGSQATAFLAACDKQRRIYEVTEDLGDDGFEIEVEMPGVVILSNAGEVNGGVSGNTVTWKFKGESLRDRPIELLATSKIAR